jgi:photosystem II stability/assembly factor-like uncharacterized protein
MKVSARKTVVAAAFVAAFVAAFAAIGAVSRSTPIVGEPLPFGAWYWTMAVSPSEPKVLVLGTSNGLYRSTDGGKTWLPTGPKGINATSLVQAGSSIFAGGVLAAPGASDWVWRGNRTFRTAPDGAAVFAASSDGGKSWQELHPRGLPNLAVQALTVDPVNKSVLYALLNTGRLYRSTDGARSFRLVSAKLGVPPWALAITHGSRFLAGNMDSGHYLSANGKKWQQSAYKDSEGMRHVMEYAVHSTDRTRVLMTSTGVEMSTDSGKTWHVVLKSQAMFGPVAWAAPKKSDVAYAVGFDRSVWRSDDGGKSWAKVS